MEATLELWGWGLRVSRLCCQVPYQRARQHPHAHGDETATASVALDGRPSIEEPHRARPPLASASCTASDAVSQVRQAARGIVTAHRERSHEAERP